MATISKLCLSASTDGRGISVADNSGTITTIHTGTVSLPTTMRFGSGRVRTQWSQKP